MTKKTKCITVQYPQQRKRKKPYKPEYFPGWETDDPEWLWYPVLVDLKLSISIEEILEAVQHHFQAEKLTAQIEAVEDLPISAVEVRRNAYDLKCLATDTFLFKHVEANTSIFWPAYQAAEYIWGIIRANSDDIQKEVNAETREQEWREDTPDYISNADALKIAADKLTGPQLSKHLRDKSNTIRWMYNKDTRRSKVQAQDFKKYIKSLKSNISGSDDLPSEAIEARMKNIEKRKKEIRETKETQR